MKYIYIGWLIASTYAVCVIKYKKYKKEFSLSSNCHTFVILEFQILQHIQTISIATKQIIQIINYAVLLFKTKRKEKKCLISKFN